MWTCPSCGRGNTTAYCPSCGERPRVARELTMASLLNQAVEAISNIDGRLLRSFWHLVARPGELTAAFINGRRKPYLGPFGVERSASARLDAILSFALLLASAIYLYRAIGMVYGGRTPWRLTSAAVLTCGAAAIVLTYRFALLLITLYTTA